MAKNVDEVPSKISDDAPLESSEEMGGDPSCWLHLFCEDCGVQLDGTEHLASCQVPASGTPTSER